MYSIWCHFDFTLLLDLQEVEQMCTSLANLSTSANEMIKTEKALKSFWSAALKALLTASADTGRWEAASTTGIAVGHA